MQLRADLVEIGQVLFPSGINFDEPSRKELFEQYKMLMQSSEQLANRRQDVNKFFLSVNSLFIAGMGFAFKEVTTSMQHRYRSPGLLILDIAIAMTGLLICINWAALLKSYGQLQQKHIAIAEALEAHLAAAMLSALVAFHRKEFTSLVSIERNIAKTFAMICVVSAACAVLLLMIQLVWCKDKYELPPKPHFQAAPPVPSGAL